MEDITLTNESIEDYHRKLNGELRKEINMWKDNEEYQRNRANSILKLFLKEREKNNKLKEQLDKYESPDDMTLMMMWATENVKEENKQLQERINKTIEYINEYAWQEDIIGGIYTCDGKPAVDRYMQLEWDNCNELLEILKGENNES